MCSMSASVTGRSDHSVLRLFSDSKLHLIKSGASHLAVNTTPGTEDVSPNQCVLTAQPLWHNFSKAWDAIVDIRVSRKPHSRSEQAHKRRLAKNINQGTGRGTAPSCNAKEIMNSNGHSSSGRKGNRIWLWESYADQGVTSKPKTWACLNKACAGVRIHW